MSTNQRTRAEKSAMLVALDAQILVLGAEADAIKYSFMRESKKKQAALRSSVILAMIGTLAARRDKLLEVIAAMDDRACLCNDWERWEDHLQEVRRRLGENVNGLDFTGNAFRFCPWCGAEREV